METKIISNEVYGKFTLSQFRTRFGNVVWMVLDADKRGLGSAEMVFCDESEDKARAWLKAHIA